MGRFSTSRMVSWEYILFKDGVRAESHEFALKESEKGRNLLNSDPV